MKTITKKNFFAVLCILLSTEQAFCDEKNIFTIKGDTLIYDTTTSDGINDNHDQMFLSFVRRNPEIKTVLLNSIGGQKWEAEEIARILIDAKLATHVEEECSSACTTIFLAGDKRTMSIGALLGFHRTSWSAKNIENFYNDFHSGENFFDFAEWLYNDTQDEVFKELGYLLERGVEAHFAIRTLQSESDDIWYPRRQDLIDSKVLIE